MVDSRCSVVDVMKVMHRMHGMHIENLEMVQLRLVDAIAETGNLSLAAEVVGLSQSAASHSLARLRKATGDQIFVRTSQRMQPTPYGEKVCAAAHQALMTLSDGFRTGRSFMPAQASRTFSVYMSEAGQLAMLPQLLDYLRKQAPGVRIHVSRLPEKNQGAALESGQMDMAIGHITTMTTGFHQRQLFHERYVCVVSKDNALFDKGMTLEAYKQSPHAIADSSGMAHWLLDKTLVSHDVVRKIGLVVPEFLALPFVVPGSDLVVTMPSRVAERFAKLMPLRVMPLPVALEPYEILLFWHSRVHTDPANQWLRQTLVELFKGYVWGIGEVGVGAAVVEGPPSQD